jgi:serine protease
MRILACVAFLVFTAVLPASISTTYSSGESESDAIDLVTGEAWLDDGIPPPRVNYLSTPFYYSLSDTDLWQELLQFEPVAIVGLKRPDLERGVFRGRVLIDENEKEEIIGQILSVNGITQELLEENLQLPSMINGDPYPAVFVRLDSLDALSELRTLSGVDYVEPLYFLDGVGCTNTVYDVRPSDTYFSPSIVNRTRDLVPWTFSHMAIVEAWRLFNNGFGTITDPGRGVKIGVVDTGTYRSQDQLNYPRFSLPSGGRRVDHLSVRNDLSTSCNHGTRIAGLAAAPADGEQPISVLGVAWGADLVTVKISDGVVNLPANSVAVVNGLRLAVAQGARVLTMAFGMPFSSAYVSDNITALFDANQNIIFVGAAGTGTGNVVFPATMDREVVTVSIVDYNPNNDGQYQLINSWLDYDPLDIVAYGPEVDFVAVSSRDGVPTTGNPQESSTTTVSGSSSATAHIAGIFALMWSRQPQMTRSEIITRLAESASIALIERQQRFVERSSEVGWGIPDAYLATGGFRQVAIAGPINVSRGSQYVLTASTDGNDIFTRACLQSGKMAA